MKFLSLSILSLISPFIHGLSTEVPHLDDALHPIWEDFVLYAKSYGKSYRTFANDHPFVLQKFDTYRLNVDRIIEHNRKYEAGEYTFTLGINELADYSTEEYKQLLGYRKSATKQYNHHVVGHTSVNVKDLPEEWDWRDHNAVTPVKNQGQCGSCWAFSAVAALESTYAIATGNLESFSEQELVDCTLNGVDRCNHGGEPMDGYMEIISHHHGQIDREKDYVYTGLSEGICKARDNVALGHFTAYANVTSGDEDALMAASATKGVISVGIDASSFTFQLYHSGVYNWPLCGNAMDSLDHGVAIAGYGLYRNKKYWLVKNSWGSGWGMKGYILMSRDKKNQCGIATMATYPIMDKEESIDDIWQDRIEESNIMSIM